MRKYLVVYEKTKMFYSAYSPDLPWFIATGKTKSIVEKQMFDALQFHLEGLKVENFPIPKPHAESEMFVFSV